MDQTHTSSQSLVRRGEERLQEKERKAGCLFIYNLSKPVFSRQESLPSLFTKFSLGIVRIAARDPVLSIRPTTDVSFFLLLRAGPLVLFRGRRSEVEKDTGKIHTRENMCQ